ncbi:hypothetical protein FIBSPDRAFT_860589 [Athelia psychrophila]|uniref:Uncharacterized protein n=1 Tax=Athelia psychrophila TaxID=1759441 RepID=A0A166K0B4_9AGAM|nr:hypothetical protein FIBSPDRAFT_860589 [Fibularhizoctonia sp. CBS 109695]
MRAISSSASLRALSSVTSSISQASLHQPSRTALKISTLPISIPTKASPGTTLPSPP